MSVPDEIHGPAVIPVRDKMEIIIELRTLEARLNEIGEEAARSGVGVSLMALPPHLRTKNHWVEFLIYA